MDVYWIDIGKAKNYKIVSRVCYTDMIQPKIHYFEKMVERTIKWRKDKKRVLTDN